MDARQRRWWQLFDSLPTRLGGITCWTNVGLPPPDADFGLHAVPTVVVCLAGVLRVTRPDARIDLGPGDALLLSAGVWHRHEPMRPGAVWFGQGFLPAASDVVLGDRDGEWRGHLPMQPSRNYLDQAVAAPDGAQRRRLLEHLIAQVLAESVDALDFGVPSVQRMVKMLWHQLHLGVTVDDLVRVSGLSRSRAYELFARGYGVTPKAAIAASRLSLADSLLAAGLPIAEVARRCGYASADSFSRCWRRAHGRSPSRR